MDALGKLVESDGLRICFRCNTTRPIYRLNALRVAYVLAAEARFRDPGC